mmetsp:Transcript_42941/g.98591  ORF Transcript_42941/g.98591 Transcript_42941/m.98591 type:complete len:236 (-) Transcript_42941:170-877(-)
MPKLVNAWNVTHCNRIVHQRMEERKHEKHLMALQSTTTTLSQAPPRDCTHLRNKVKTRKLQEDRAAEIQLENRILLQKMLNIDTKPSQFNGDIIATNRRPLRSLHGDTQRKELDRITLENQDLLRRLQTVKPTIDPRGWEEEEMDRQAIKFRISQNSSRARVLKLPMPNKDLPAAPFLPRIGELPAKFHQDDWSNLSNGELDRQLQAVERHGQQQLQDGPDPAMAGGGSEPIAVP